MESILKQYQPIGSKLCGQLCVSMLCRISVEKSIQLIGKKGSTTGSDLIKAINALNFKTDRLTRLSGTRKISLKYEYYSYLPDICIVKLRAKGIKSSHWALIYHGETYDPDPPERYGRTVGYEYISAYIRVSV